MAPNFAVVDFMAYQWKKLPVIWPLRPWRIIYIVMKHNSRGENKKRTGYFLAMNIRMCVCDGLHTHKQADKQARWVPNDLRDVELLCYEHLSPELKAINTKQNKKVQGF